MSSAKSVYILPPKCNDRAGRIKTNDVTRKWAYICSPSQLSLVHTNSPPIHVLWKKNNQLKSVKI